MKTRNDDIEMKKKTKNVLITAKTDNQENIK